MCNNNIFFYCAELILDTEWKFTATLIIDGIVTK